MQVILRDTPHPPYRLTACRQKLLYLVRQDAPGRAFAVLACQPKR
jgi:hypothetical protein